MASNKQNDYMEIRWICNGNPDRIPKIGEKIEIKPHVLFVVESYGESTEIPCDLYAEKNTAYEVKLRGHLLIPEGSPINVIEDLIDGKL